MRGSVVAGVLSAGLFAGSALAQDAVQWRVEDGGNGHWYQVEVASGDFWQKQATATNRGGHLATVQSDSENSFIAALVAALAWPNEACSASLGGYQDRNSADFSEPAGGWRWVTGEPFDFTAWRGGEPNNHGGSEDFLGFWRFDCAYMWNDGGNPDPVSPFPTVLEWSADCNGDGVVDYGQIRAGELDDANANNIPDCCEQGVACDCPADIDGSGVVNAIDLAIVIGYWGTDGGKDYPQADIDGSGDIDGADLATLLGSWGACE